MKDKDGKEIEIEMLSQPLLTEEGFINPAGMNELETAINNIQPTYIRCSDDPEWTTKRCTTKKEITSRLARWAIEQSPYCWPEGLEVVIKYLDACLQNVNMLI